MMRRMSIRLILACLSVSALPAATTVARAADDNVTVYRCVDARGHVTLRDSPCSKGQAQEARSMLRPKDAPYRPPAPSPRPAEPRAEGPAREVVVVHTPRPLYECVTPDGDLYTSETPEGHPRWVPLWTLDVPLYAPGPYGYTGGVDHTGLTINTPHVRFTTSSTRVHQPVYADAAWATAGTWIRDTCHPLPQADVCARLRDRRAEIDRRFFNAQPNERDQLRTEERGVVARLDDDCGGA
jgi:hypothetical protein